MIHLNVTLSVLAPLVKVNGESNLEWQEVVVGAVPVAPTAGTIPENPPAATPPATEEDDAAATTASNPAAESSTPASEDEQDE